MFLASCSQSSKFSSFSKTNKKAFLLSTRCCFIMNEPIDYFFQTSPKKWDITDAINIYDGSKQYDSFISLLEEIQHDLGVVVARQPTFQRYATSIMVRIGVRYKIDKIIRR
jgi:hypothetical protein